MLLGNAQLEQVLGEEYDNYGNRTAGGRLWHGRTACRVVDRSRTNVAGGGDTFHQTMIWLPAGLIADDGSPLYFQIGWTLEIRQDGVVTSYVVSDWSDFGQRLLGSPSDVRVNVERRPA